MLKMRVVNRPAILFPLVLLAMLALLTFWINQVVQPIVPKLDGSGRHDPDYMMSNFVTTQTDINGALRYKLAATEMKHFPDDDTTELQRPRYTQFAIDKPYTQVEGLRGYMSSNGDKIELFDNVKITRQAFAGKGEMTVETSYLSILPKTEIVRTDRAVVIRQAPKTVVHATGMLYDKKKNTVSLLHKVRAHYERPNVRVRSIKHSVDQSKKNEATKVSVNKSKRNEKKSKMQRSKSKKSKLQQSKSQQSKLQQSKLQRYASHA